MKLLKRIIEIFYPTTCGICGQKINTRYTCRKCLNIIEYYQGRVDFLNGKDGHYDKLISLLPYEGIFKEKMLNYKFHDAKYLGATFAEILTNFIEKYNIKADIILAVPISKARLHERGYNQSSVIAKKVSEFTGIEYQEQILLKKKNNLRQSELTVCQRKLNVKDVYYVRKREIVKNKTIILIDDIITTGATLNECAKILKECGAREVIGLTVMYAKNERINSVYEIS